MNVLYIDLCGQVRAGRLVTGAAPERGGAMVLVSRTGDALGPIDVAALLAPLAPTEEQRFLLWRAVRGGYRVQPP